MELNKKVMAAGKTQRTTSILLTMLLGFGAPSRGKDQVLVLETTGPALDKEDFSSLRPLSAFALKPFTPDEVHRAHKVTFPSGETYKLKGKTIGSTERLLTLVYLRQGGDDVEAYLTLNRDRGVVTGSVTTEGTAVYLVEHHPKYGQVWITTDDSLNLGGPDDTLEDDEDEPSDRSALTLAQVRQALDRGKKDTKTVARISLKIYVSTAMMESYVGEEMDDLIANAVARTNQGYVNSRVSLRLFVHCVEEYRGEEKDSDHAMVRAFKAYKSSVAELLGSADLAILLVKTDSYGGVAYLNSYKNPVGVVSEWAARSGFIFGHEVGHILGLHHNAEAIGKAPPNFGGLGYLIPDTDKRTIMAYAYKDPRGVFQHRLAINRHSSRSGKDEDGDRVGTVVEDASKVLNDRRFIYEMIGDESAACGGGKNEEGNPGDGRPVIVLMGGSRDDTAEVIASTETSKCAKNLPDLPPHPDGGMWSLGMGLTRNGAPMVCKESSCVYYDAGSDSWKSGRDLQRPKSRASTARAKGGTWYIIGGTSATTDKILPTGEQIAGPDLPADERKWYFTCSAVSSDGASLFVAHGFGPAVFRLDVASGEWTRLRDMGTSRKHPACGVAASSSGKGEDFVVVGGALLGGGARAYLDTVEIYSTETGKWREGTKYPEKVWNARSVAVGDSFVVAGGLPHSGRSFEYDTTTSKGDWRPWSEFKASRPSHSAAAVERAAVGC